MEKVLNIYQRIVEVMKEVKYVQKSEKKINNMYSFVSHDSVSSALHEPMARHGIAMIPSIIDLVQDASRTTVKMDISFINADNPSDKVSLIYYGYGIDSQDKGIGKAVSYAVKYALLKTFCLETGDDVEKDLVDHSTVDQEKSKAASNSLKKLLIKDFSEEDSEWFDKYVKAIAAKLNISIEDSIIKVSELKDVFGDLNKYKAKQLEKAAA